jgi:PAS domain S-box-containing protein
MPLRNVPIRRKLMTIMLVTSGLVLLITCTTFLAYEFATYRRTASRELSTLAQIIAANSTAALAFQNQDDAREVLAALAAEPHIVVATLYDLEGRIFSIYPDDLSPSSVPETPGPDGLRYAGSLLAGFEPVVEGNRRLGTLYLQADVTSLYQRLGLFVVIGLLVTGVSLLLAFVVARKLQQQISQPIIALAQTARAVSERQDYSVRATRVGHDEVGLLTEAFNQMLDRIQEQNQTLRENTERVRAVVNSALSAVIVTDRSGVITDWNTRAEMMFGLTRDEALGHAIEGAVIAPAHREAFRRALDRPLGGLPSGQGNPPIQIAALRRDRQEFPVELAVSPLRTADGVSFCSFITDITERLRAEERLHAQLARLSLLNRITRAIGERQDLPSIFQVVMSTLEDNMPIAMGCICLYDAVSESLTVAGVGSRSRPLAAKLGMTDRAGIPVDNNGLARCLRGELVYEDDIGGLAYDFPRALASQGLRSLVVAPLLLESHVFGTLIAAREESRGFSSGDCEFLRQLSEHVALAAHQVRIYGALQQAYDDLRQSQQAAMQHERLRALGEMASGIAHDVNNAISPAAIYTQLLLESEPDLTPAAREHLETVYRAIEDVAATIARMREFYRHREPQALLAPTSLNALVQQVLHLTRVRWSDMLQAEGVVIQAVTELAPDLPLVMVAESEIREALTNLVFNAVDAMPDGGRLTVRTRVVGEKPVSSGEPDLRQVQVEVSDTGRGMDEETRRRCLEPFFTTKGERGTGLGLAMVYGVVQRHSADIDIDSTPGVGSTVRLSFAVPTSAEVVAPAAAGQAPHAPRRILLVDDDPLVLKAMRDTLEAAGHSVEAVDGGQQGIDRFRQSLGETERFDAVITDLGMPYVDGRQVAAAVKQASPSTLVLMLTGWGQRMAEQGDVPAHVDRVLSKPPKLRELSAALALLNPPPGSRTA